MGSLHSLPREIVFPWRWRFIGFLHNTTQSVAYLVEKVTGKPYVVTLQSIIAKSKPVNHMFPEVQVEEKVLDDIPVRLYKSNLVVDSDMTPCILYIHGGGFVCQTVDCYDGFLVRLALQTNMVILAVSYSKAPQKPFPAAFEECVKAATYVLQNGIELGIDSKRVVIAGDSAGGNLTAAVALKLSLRETPLVPPLKLQVLINPALQALSFNTKSYLEAPKCHLSKELMMFYWAAYLGLDIKSDDFYSIMAEDGHVSTNVQRSVHGSYIDKVRDKVFEKYDEKMAQKLDHMVVNQFACPLMAEDLTKVSPAYVITSQFDQLRDEGILYSERLKEAGVKTVHWNIENQPHLGFAILNFKGKLNVGDIEEIADKLADYIKNVCVNEEE